MSDPKAILRSLIEGSEEDKCKAWSDFFLNVEMVRYINSAVDKETAKALIVAGLAWGGAGWSNTKAFKDVYDVSGVPIVTKDFQEYKGLWILQLCTHW